jgi:DNA replication protein DnaC
MAEGRNVFITGSTGTGKSYLATALGYRACQKGHKVLYANTARLMAQLRMAKTRGTILQELKKIERTELLILDDFAFQPFDAQARNHLMDIMEYERIPTLIASQIPVQGCYDAITDKTVANALMDRIVHQAIRIELYGESLRKTQVKKN